MNDNVITEEKLLKIWNCIVLMTDLKYPSCIWLHHQDIARETQPDLIAMNVFYYEIDVAAVASCLICVCLTTANWLFL